MSDFPALPPAPLLSDSPAHANVSPTALARLACALEMWQGEGAQLVSLPWTSPAASGAGMEGVETSRGSLLTAAGQALCLVALQGRLEGPGPFVGWAPCFREEPEFGPLHHFGFLHAAAFAWADPSPLPIQVLALAHRTLSVMRLLAGVGTPVHLTPAVDGIVSVVLGGVKVGNCGSGSLAFGGQQRHYLYATVLSEPRFSTALALARPR